MKIPDGEGCKEWKELEKLLRSLPHLESKYAQSMAADLKEIRESAELPENPWRNY